MSRSARFCAALCILGLLGTTYLVPAEDAPAKPATPPVEDSDAAKELLSGRVVFVADALKRRGVKHNAEELKGQVALETKDGGLWPIVPDWRGRAFYQDARLRDRPVDLVVRRTPGLPYVQVLMIFTFSQKTDPDDSGSSPEAGVRQYMDYWCDICAIPMYEIKDCECCQGPVRLRFQAQELPAYLQKAK